MSKTTEHTATLPAGEYYIGDLCYVMHKEWDEVIDLMFPSDIQDDCVEGLLSLADGRTFFYGTTAWGDGLFSDNRYGSYPVDAGLIGIIAVKDIAEEERENMQNGKVYTFEHAFDVYACGGTYDFGGILINTDYQDDEDDCWEDGYDDEEEEFYRIGEEDEE